MFDFFEIDADTQEDAINKLLSYFPSNLLMNKEKILMMYNVLRIEDAPRIYDIFKLKKGFYFKKKRLFNGANQYYLASRFSKYMMSEKDLKYIALSIGLEEDSVKKHFGRPYILNNFL